MSSVPAAAIVATATAPASPARGLDPLQRLRRLPRQLATIQHSALATVALA